MKKRVIQVAMLSLLVVSSCKRRNTTFEGFFYSDTKSNVPLYLFIDGVGKGKLPGLNVVTSQNNDTILRNGLHVTMKTGNYSIVGKDSLGNVKSSGNLSMKAGSLDGAGYGSSDGVRADAINHFNFGVKITPN